MAHDVNSHVQLTFCRSYLFRQCNKDGITYVCRDIIWDLMACSYENAQPAFGPLCRGHQFTGAEILLCLYEASSPVCRGSNGLRDIVFMCMEPERALLAIS